MEHETEGRKPLTMLQLTARLQRLSPGFQCKQWVPLDVVQLLLGHAHPRTTQLYARLSLGTARQAYDRTMGALRGIPLTNEMGG